MQSLTMETVKMSVESTHEIDRIKLQTFCAHSELKEMEMNAQHVDSMHKSLATLSSEVSKMCHKIDRLDIALGILLKAKEAGIAGAWEVEKNGILSDYERQSRRHLQVEIKRRRDDARIKSQQQFDHAYEEYRKTRTAPDGFTHEISLLNMGKITRGHWTPCKIDKISTNKKSTSFVDVTIAGGTRLFRVDAKRVRKRRSYKNNQRERLENDLSSFMPRITTGTITASDPKSSPKLPASGLVISSSEEDAKHIGKRQEREITTRSGLDTFYDDVSSDDSDVRDELICPGFDQKIDIDNHIGGDGDGDGNDGTDGGGSTGRMTEVRQLPQSHESSHKLVRIELNKQGVSQHIQLQNHIGSKCDACQRRLHVSDAMLMMYAYQCRKCDVDICSFCYQKRCIDVRSSIVNDRPSRR